MVRQEKRFIIAFLLLGVVMASWTNSPLIRTSSIVAISSLTDSTQAGSSVTATFSSALTCPLVDLNWGLGLIGYESYLTNSFSFNITMNNIALGSLTLTPQPKDGTYLKRLKIRYIVSGILQPQMELKAGCYKCMNITSGWGNRSEPFTTPANVSASSTLIVKSFLFGFNFSNTVGKINQFSVATTIIGSSYSHMVSTVQNVSVSYVCLTTIAWETSTDVPGNGLASRFQSYVIDRSVLPIQIPPIYITAFDTTDVGFFGFFKISHQMGGIRIFEIYPQTYNLLPTKIIYNDYFTQAHLNVFYAGTLTCGGNKYNPLTLLCVATCPNTTAVVGNACIACDIMCLTCSATNNATCLTCYNNTNRTGGRCACTGAYFEVAGAVGSTPCGWCRSVLANCTSCANGSVCTGCDATFSLVNGLCRCGPTNTSYLVNGICLSYPGCQIAYGATNTNYCHTCNGSANFQHFNSTNLVCVCKTGYNNSVDPTVCTSLCGDGLVDSTTGCDTGPTPNPGCVNCTIQTGYYCYVVTGTVGPSICIPISTTTISYLYAKRIVGTNKAEFYFKVQPANLAIPANTFASKVTTDAPSATLTPVYDQTTSRITLTMEFTSSLQSNAYSFTFDFSKLTTYYSTPQTVSVVAEGVNQPLVLLSYSIFVKTMQYLLMGLSFVGLGMALVAGLVGKKLWGLQLLLPIQAAFFAQFGMKLPPNYISQLKALQYSTGYNQLLPYNYESAYRSGSKLPHLDYDVEFGLNVNIMNGLMLLSSLILLVLQIIYLIHHYKWTREQAEIAPTLDENKKGKKKQEKIQVREDTPAAQGMKAAKARRDSYLNCFYFGISMTIMQEVVVAFLVSCGQVKVENQVLGSDINILIAFFSLLLLIANLVFLLGQTIAKREKRSLVFSQTRKSLYPILLIGSYLLLALICGISYSFSIAPYVILGASLLPILSLLIMRPYSSSPSCLDTLTSLLTQLIIVGSSAIYLLNDVTKMGEIGWLGSAAAVVGLVAVGEAFTVVRMVKGVEWRQLWLVQKCIKRGKKPFKQDLLQKKPEVQLSEMVKQSIMGENKMVNWEQRNQQGYESIRSAKGDQDEKQDQSQENEEDELLVLKRRLKKEIQTKRTN